MQQTSWNSIITYYSLFWLGMVQCLTVTLKQLHGYRLQQGNTSAPSAEAECTEETQLLKKLVKDNIWKQASKKVENLVNYKVVNI
jgi:hypothetical protein